MGLILSLDNSIHSFNTGKFVLDQYTGAAAAYSLRMLSVNTTNVIRVRRSSDNAEADFTATEITDGTLTSFVGSENLFFPSETFTSWGNIGGSTITSNTTETNDPFGGSNATKVVAGSSILIYKGTFTNVVRTQTFYAKAGTCETFGMYFGGGFNATFNISADNPSVVSTTNTSATITAVGDGWYRCSATLTSIPASDYFAGVNFSPTSGTTFYIFGAQLEGGTSASEYNKTTTGIGGYGYVTTWYDQAGSNDATQGTAANQPNIVNAGVLVEENGKPAVDFDGTDDFMGYSESTPSNTFSGFFVGKTNDGSTEQNFYDYGIDGGGSIATRTVHSSGVGNLGSSPTNTISVRSLIQANNYSIGTTSTTNQILLSHFSDGSSVDGYLDSTQMASSYSNRSINNDFVVIGARADGAINLDGVIQEVIFYDSDQSSNRTNIETLLNNYYSIYP